MRIHRLILTVLALLSRSLAWFPLWLLLLLLCPLQPLAGTAVLLTAAGCCTAIAARLVRQRFAGKPFLRSAGTVLTVLLLGTVCVCLLYGMTGSVAVPVILSAVTLTAAAQSAKTEPDQLFAPMIYAAFLTGILVARILIHFAYLPMPDAAMLAAVCAETLSFFMLRNQFMLLRMVNRRSNTEIDVPAHIRRGNLLMVAGVAAAVAVCLLLREQIAAGLQALGNLAAMLARVLLEGLTKLTAWLGGDAPAEPLEIDMEAEPEPIPAGNMSKLWLLLWIPFAAVAVYIWRLFLSDWVWALREALEMLAARLLSGGRAARRADGSQHGYTDTETAAERVQSRHSAMRTWRRKLRNWRKMPDSAQKFYAGYALLLTAPAWQKGTVRASDTAQEICAKWRLQAVQPDALDAVTADLHADRYAQNGLPAEALRDMEQALLLLRKTFKA